MVAQLRRLWHDTPRTRMHTTTGRQLDAGAVVDPGRLRGDEQSRHGVSASVRGSGARHGGGIVNGRGHARTATDAATMGTGSGE